MSPRFNPNGPPQNQGMNQQMMVSSTPNSQMSPHFNQQSQWNMRQQGLQNPMGMPQVWNSRETGDKWGKGIDNLCKIHY